LNGIKSNFFECPYVEESFRHKIRNFINDLENEYPGTKFNLFNSFINFRKILMREYEEKKKEKVNYCKKCGEPTSKEICRACELLENLKNENEKE
ncbi:MAG: TIGR00269 family protein, partial [Candidatus Aenigmatarchaeota archaeon]